jgi:hypothetical protein
VSTWNRRSVEGRFEAAVEVPLTLFVLIFDILQFRKNSQLENRLLVCIEYRAEVIDQKILFS